MFVLFSQQLNSYACTCTSRTGVEVNIEHRQFMF